MRPRVDGPLQLACITYSWPSVCGSPESAVPHLWIQPTMRHVALSCVCAQPCPTLCSLMGYRLPCSSVHGICQARVMEWVISFSSIVVLTIKKKKNPCISGLAQFILVWIVLFKKNLNYFTMLHWFLLYNNVSQHTSYGCEWQYFKKKTWISLQCCIGFCCTTTHLSSLLSFLSLSPSHASRSSQSPRLRLPVIEQLPITCCNTWCGYISALLSFAPLSPSLVTYSHCAIHMSSGLVYIAAGLYLMTPPLILLTQVTTCFWQ